MFGRIAKALLIVSAIAPIGLVYAWVLFSDGHQTTAFWIVVACGILILLCAYLLKEAHEVLERFPFKMTTVEAADRENIAFLLLYLSPLFTAQFGQLNMALLMPTVLIFALLTATGYNYHFNPLLGLVGWHFYKVSSAEGVTYVLVTRKQLRNTNQIGSVGQLTDYILIDLERTNAG